MPIQWRKQMSVGNLIIDLDHRILICMINMVEYALKEPDDLTQLRDAFDQLADYAREHFRSGGADTVQGWLSSLHGSQTGAPEVAGTTR